MKVSAPHRAVPAKSKVRLPAPSASPNPDRCRSAPGLLLGVVLVIVMGLANAQAFPAGQYGDVPEGITLEVLAAVPNLPDQSRKTGAFLLRYTYAPGARLDLPYPGPALVYVEAGTLTLEQVGGEVSILDPSAVNGQPLAGQLVEKRQRGATVPVGAHAEVAAGGSVYSETGDLGPTRNAGADELVLLVMQFVTDSRHNDVTRIAVEGTPRP